MFFFSNFNFFVDSCASSSAPPAPHLFAIFLVFSIFYFFCICVTRIPLSNAPRVCVYTYAHIHIYIHIHKRHIHIYIYTYIHINTTSIQCTASSPAEKAPYFFFFSSFFSYLYPMHRELPQQKKRQQQTIVRQRPEDVGKIHQASANRVAYTHTHTLAVHWIEVFASKKNKKKSQNKKIQGKWM